MINFILFLIIASPSVSAQHPQSQELLGKQAKKLKIINPNKINSYITKTLNNKLPPAYKKQSPYIKKTIIANAKKHQLDPVFVMAVISGESSFNPQAKGPVGEIGLMQLRPKTAKWVSEELLNKKYAGDHILQNPHENIRLGTAYLAWLRTKFKISAHYVAAYNLGPGKLKQAIKKEITPRDYPRHIMKRYVALYQEY